MARNEEKAQSMLNRWLAYKRQLAAGGPRPKPNSPAECETVEECERWRMNLIKDIGKKVMIIQNESLGEQRIRDLNDEINKLLREKEQWEKRILELGGPDYRKYERIADEQQLREQQPTMAVTEDQKGHAYKYFGAARNLPGVRELFMKKEQEAEQKKQKKELTGLDAEYFGYQDDQDALLEQAEAKAEQEALAEAQNEWNKHQHNGPSSSAQGLDKDISHLVVPTKEQMTERVVAKRRDVLLKKYLSEELEQSMEEQKKEVEVVLGKRKSRA